MTFLRELQPIMRQGLGINQSLTLKLDTLYGEIIYITIEAQRGPTWLLLFRH